MDKYVYMDDMGYMIGLPARDIDSDEWQDYPEDLRKAALKAKIFILVKEKSEVNKNVKRS